MAVKLKLTDQETYEGRVKVDPQLAEKILNDHNESNRPLRNSKVRDYARDMLKGNWRYNPADAICFDTRYQLLNGQHRLWAVIDSGTTQEFLFVTGIDPKVQEVMDSGLKRNAGQQLALQGYGQYTALSVMAKWYLKWNDGSIVTNSRQPSTVDILDWVDQADQAALEFALTIGEKYRRVSPFSVGTIAAIAYEAYLIDAEDAKAFFNSLIEGVGLEEGSPILVMNKYVQHQIIYGKKMLMPTQMFLMIVTWNRWRKNDTRFKSMRQPNKWVAEDFPRMK